MTLTADPRLTTLADVPVEKLHTDEVDIDVELVEGLVADQFPQWVGRPVGEVRPQGTDNAMFRLGDDLAVRMPRTLDRAAGIAHEREWLPRIAAHLPVGVPLPVATGRPGRDYPCAWAVTSWLPGANPTAAADDDAHQLAVDLAEFVAALQSIDTRGEQGVGPLWSYRGGPLAARQPDTRAAIVACDGLLDTQLVTDVWEDVSRVTEGVGPPRWIHTDLQPGNLLVAGHRLCGVIDFGGLAIGDPAVDTIVAWNLLGAESRQTFRETLDVDDETWARGRAWALSIGLVALPYYQHTDRTLAQVSRRQIDAVVSDHLQTPTSAFPEQAGSVAWASTPATGPDVV